MYTLIKKTNKKSAKFTKRSILKNYPKILKNLMSTAVDTSLTHLILRVIVYRQNNAKIKTTNARTHILFFSLRLRASALIF
ncbi:MAG: hypothetical protein CL608_29505 [Anaerolineaceae bacterium]|nr:hypothetical protein [Anaerolineaceae bacterium]